MKFLKGLEYGIDYAILKHEGVLGPVGGKTQALHLRGDEARVFFYKLGDVFVQGFSVELKTGFSFFF